MDWTANETSYSVSDLTSSTKYYFVVIVEDSAGNKSLYKPASQSTLDITPPTAGAAISFSNVISSRVGLSWGAAIDDVTNQSNLVYVIYYSLSPNLTSIAGTESNGTALGGWRLLAPTGSLVITGLNSFTTYYVAVIVSDEAGNKTLYNQQNVTTKDTSSPVPGSNINFTDVTATGMSVSWGAATDKYEPQANLQYKLVYSTINNLDTAYDAEYNGIIAMDWSTNALSCPVTGLTSSTQYYFAVLVKDSLGNESAYPCLNQATLDITIPIPVTGITFSNGTSTSVTVSWNAATDDFTPQTSLSYKLVYSSTNSLDTVSNAENNGTIAMDWSTNTLTKTVRGIVHSTTYYFAVIVKDASGNKALYPQLSITTLDPMWQELGSPGFRTAGPSIYSSLYVYNGVPYVAYQDDSLNYKETVMKYDSISNTWVAVGSPGFSAGSTDYCSLFVYNNIPYVAYADSGSNSKVTVMKYNGSSWEAVGPAGFSVSNITGPTIFVYNDTPYVSYLYLDSNYLRKPMVMKYNGSSWETVGSVGIPAGQASSLLLYIDNGTPYVAYLDDANSYKPTVMKYNGSSWETVGSAGFSAGQAWNLSLYVDDGTPYVAYVDEANNYKLTVMKFNSSSWETVGPAGFSVDQAWDSSLYIDNGTPYVAYTDRVNLNTTVMKYNGSSWETVGPAGLFKSLILNTPLFVYNGTPYVVYFTQDFYGGVMIFE